jgi:hypothetical protein
MSANIINEYLVSLGYAVDSASFQKLNQSLNTAQKAVETATTGMTRSVGMAAMAITGSLVAVNSATVGLLDTLAKADMGYQKMALRMWISKQSAKELKTTMDALGESMEDIAFIPELRGQFNQLLTQGRGMQPPDEYAQQMRDIRSIGFEFKRMKLEASYALEWVGYYLFKYLEGPIRNIKKWLSEFNDNITKTMPQWTEKIARVLASIMNVGMAYFRLMKNVFAVMTDIWNSFPRGVQVALGAFAVLGAAIISGPFGVALLTIGAILVLLEDFFGYIDGRESSKTLAPMWKWLIDMYEKIKNSKALEEFTKQWKKLKEQVDELRESLVELFLKIKEFMGITTEDTTNAFTWLLETWLKILTNILKVITAIAWFWSKIFKGDSDAIFKEFDKFLEDMQKRWNNWKPFGTTSSGGFRGEPTYEMSADTSQLTGEKNGLDEGFLSKLNRLAKAQGRTLNIDDGFRTYAEQAALWERSDKSGKWVAAPGTSRHEAGYAIDAKWAESMTDEELARYGLWRPMDYEPWHVEPIETKGKSTAELIALRKSGRSATAAGGAGTNSAFAPTGSINNGVQITNHLVVSLPAGSDADGIANTIVAKLEQFQGRANNITITRQMRDLQGVNA